jgi:hypothetical protein
MPAHLPAGHYARTIGDMDEGEVGYTVPWAMMVNMDGACYLNLRYDIFGSKQGTVQMKVLRGTNGYVVTLLADYQYMPTNNTPWVGARPDDVAPVHELR